MKTTLDSNLRTFQIVDSFGRSIFCNLQDIVSICTELNDCYRIYHFWNSKPQKVSKSYLKEMLQSNDIQFNKQLFYNML